MERIDVFYELIDEIHKICNENNLTYFMYGDSSVDAFTTGEIKPDRNYIYIAMTQGDAERFLTIAQKKIKNNELKNRFVESRKTNPKFLSAYMMYGDTNTFEYSLKDLRLEKNRHIENKCIHVKIKFIEKLVPASARRKKVLMRKLWKAYELDFNTFGLWFARIPIAILHFFAKIFCGKKYEQTRYNFEKGIHYIDHWDDIKRYDQVKISKKVFDSKWFDSVDTIKAGSIDVNIIGNYECFMGANHSENWMNRKTKSVPLYSTAVSYDELKSNPEYQQAVKDAEIIYEKIYKKRLKSRSLRRKIARVKSVVLMSKYQIGAEDLYNEQKDEIARCVAEKDYAVLDEIIEPVLKSSLKLERKGIAYDIPAELDKVLADAMARGGYEKRYKNILKLRNKKFFVE